MSIHNKVQLYSENSNIKYPLSDTQVTSVPDDLILDMSVSVPASIPLDSVKATNIICRNGYVMVSLEAGTTPIAHAFVLNPQPFIIYPMTCSAANNACIVFGPGVARETNQSCISLDLDPRVLLHKIKAANIMRLSVNGFEYDMPQTLNIVCNNYLQTTAEPRYLTMDMMSSSSTMSNSSQTGSSSASNLENCLVISRNDTTVSDRTSKYGLIDKDFSQLPLYSINDVKADSTGNITITLTAQSTSEFAELMPIVSDGNNIGLLIVTDNVEACDDPYKPLMQKIKDGRTGYGSPYELPLDIYALENDTSSSESGPWGPE